jgi:uncharacterized protein
MVELLSSPLPWYLTGPLIGIIAVLLLVWGNKQFGISSNFRHLCAACVPSRLPYFQLDRHGSRWNLAFAAGVLLGGFLAGVVFANPEPIAISAATRADLAALGIRDFTGLVPREIFSLESLVSPRGLVILIGGGFLTGFGTAYAGGCTSGHGILGLASLQLASLIAVIAFFAAGIATTAVLLPLILGAG